MSAPRVPPSEAELEEMRRHYAKTGAPPCAADIDRMFDEIERLRGLCGRAKAFIDRHPTGLPGNYKNGQMIDELDKAAKGEQ